MNVLEKTPKLLNDKITFREEAIKSDCKNIVNILESSGFFYPFEINVAVELLQDYIEDKDSCDYSFIFVEYEGKTVAYSCYAFNPFTVSSYEIYWMAVHNDYRGHGIGKVLMQKTEDIIAKLGGKKIYIETSGRELYEPTRKFYDKCGYTTEAVIKDFYADGDDKVMGVKKLK